MFDEKRILSLIPARGGSKRLAHKNTLPLQGKPLIGWTIEAAKKSKYIDEIVVSTDDNEIAKIATKFGASVPFMRPAQLATDTASSYSVVIHCLNYFKQKNVNFDKVLLLQPTSPLRTEEHIDEAIASYFQKDASALVSVCECDHSPLWSNVLPASKSLANFMRPETVGLRGQDLPKYYRLNGAIYMFDVNEYIKTEGNFYGPNAFGYEMNNQASIDIDTKTDFQLATLILQEQDESTK
jgi:CMP-N,N'-diacetyllegionaminic acid synthase